METQKRQWKLRSEAPYTIVHNFEASIDSKTYSKGHANTYYQ